MTEPRDRDSVPSHWKEVRFDLSREMPNTELDRVLSQPSHVRLEWLYDGLHRLSHHRHCPRWVHRWLVRSRVYRWWGRQRYGPSILNMKAREIADAIDRDLVAMYATAGPSKFDTPIDTAAKLDRVIGVMLATEWLSSTELAVIEAIETEERSQAAIARVRENIRENVAKLTARPDPFRAFRQLSRRLPRNGL